MQHPAGPRLVALFLLFLSSSVPGSADSSPLSSSYGAAAMTVSSNSRPDLQLAMSAALRRDPSGTPLTVEQKDVAVTFLDGLVEDLVELEDDAEAAPEPPEAAVEEITAADLEEVANLELLADAARWLAQEGLQDEPGKIADALMVAAYAARFAGLKPSLWAYLEGLELEDRSLRSIARIAPRLDPDALRRLRARMRSMPAMQSLDGALLSEKVLMLQEERKRISRAVEAWQSGEHDAGALPFPNNIRMAGFIQSGDKPVMISLHDIATSRYFWIKEGETLNGIFCERVNRETLRAWIQKDGVHAQVDLRSEFVLARDVPWPVIFQLYGIDRSSLSEEEIAAEEARLAGLGIAPSSILGNLDAIETFYRELSDQLKLPDDELERWLSAKEEAMPDYLPQKSVLKHLPTVLDAQRQFEMERGAFEAGLDYLLKQGPAEHSPTAANPATERYRIEHDDSGFTVRLEPLENKKHENQIEIRFGDSPLIAEATTNP